MPVKPTEKEEEYFVRLEFERLQKTEQEKQKKIASEEKKRLQELHYMQCPKCGMKLVEIDYKGIKVDKCTACEGVWLDAGELAEVAKLDKSVVDKLISVFKK
jgi:uncharacterized protein